MWINNALFKYDDDRNLQDCTLVDYSVGYFGSPAIDLCYFLYSSTADSIKENDFDLLVHDYTIELQANLKKFGYSRKIPSITDIQIEIMKKGYVGVIFTSFLIPLRLLENAEDADVSGLIGTDEKAKAFREFLFSTKGFRERISYLLSYYDRKGFLEIE